MAIRAPFNFKQWIDEHRHLLKPPVGARRVFEDSQFIVMVVGGPNARKDYHLDPGEEFFYQLEGSMVLKIVNEDGGFQDIEIKEGEIFMLPANVPHSPQRLAGTVGLVIERPRLDHEEDGLRWYCDQCGEVIFEAFFKVENLPAQIKATVDRFLGDEGLRTCKGCGHLNSGLPD